jgi:putative tryptophan/tyrosine transport system substrate-binding protein
MMIRALIAVGIVTTLVTGTAAWAQPIDHVGVLVSGAAPAAGTSEPNLEALRRGLAELGHVDGRTIAVDVLWPADGRADRLPDAAASLIALKPAAIVAIGGAAARAMKAATATVPVVFAIVVDPVSIGLVSRLERPGANITGFTIFDPDESRQKIEVLKAAIPGLARVAILGDAAVQPILDLAAEKAARAAGLEPQRLSVKAPDPDFVGAFAAATRERAQAVIVLSHPIMGPHRARIAELATKHRLPILVPPHHADAGALIGYGTGLSAAAHRAAHHVDAILKGAKPGDLPVETVREPELVVNLRTAESIGMSLPTTLLDKATRVIR